MGRNKKEEVEIKADERLILLEIGCSNFNDVEYKNYMKIEDKIGLVVDLADRCCQENEYGILSVDPFSKEIYFKLLMIANYTNIDLEGINAFEA